MNEGFPGRVFGTESEEEFVGNGPLALGFVHLSRVRWVDVVHERVPVGGETIGLSPLVPLEKRGGQLFRRVEPVLAHQKRERRGFHHLQEKEKLVENKTKEVDQCNGVESVSEIAHETSMRE